jgi:hypothetical protein
VKFITDALLVKLQNRRTSKFQNLCENNLLVELEDTGNAIAHHISLTPMAVTCMAQQLNTLQNAFIHLLI